MKTLSIVIPCLNSERFLPACLDSLLIERDDELDVIVVNDGSSDATSAIAHAFADKHPFVRVIDKANGGHGSGVNAGLAIAQGLYFKILDSDDFLDKEGLIHLLDTIKDQNDKDQNPDLYLSDYCSYNEGNERPQARLSFRKSVKKVEEIITWNEMPRIRIHDFFMIHMAYVRTALLREINLPLLEKTLYEDNQYMFYVVKNTKTLFYLDRPIYKYSVGKEEQSTSVGNMSKKYRNQYRVMAAVITHITLEEYRAMEKPLRFHIRHEIFKLGLLVWFYTYIGKGSERHKAYRDFFKHFKAANPEIYHLWRYKTPSFLLWMWLPFLRHLVAVVGYKICAKKKGWK